MTHATTESELLRAENQRLRALLRAAGIDPDAQSSAQVERLHPETAAASLRAENQALEQRADAADEHRFQAEATARDSAEQFRLLVQSVVDYAIYMLDPTGRVTNWNAGAQRIKGYTPDEIIGQHFSRFFTEEDRASGLPQRALQTALQQGKFEAEGWRVRKNGERFWAMVVVDPVYAEDGTHLGFAKVTRDITPWREAQMALEQTREALFQSQKMEAIGQLTGGIAHDFNNLLAGIIGSLELLQRRLAQGQREGLQRYLDAAVTSANRAAALTARLLAFGRRQPLDTRPADLNALVASLADLLIRTLGETVTLETRLDPALWPALVDANQFENALLNLAINARDAMPDGGKLTIESGNAVLDAAYAQGVEGLQPGDYVVVAVSDTGQGMPPEIVARAFEPFFTTKPQGQGTGLGLSMIYGFARQAGGHVKIYSEPDVGTTVKLYMPRHLDGAVPAEPQPEHISAPRGRGERVLVVEDDPAVRMLVTETLAELGYQADEAQEGKYALPRIEDRERLDLLITDVGLPGGMNGRQLADYAWTRRPDLKVLFITGYAEGAAIRASLLPPGGAMITKPFALDVLATRIRELLGRID